MPCHSLCQYGPCCNEQVLGLNPTRGTDNVKSKPDHISGLTISSSLHFAFPLNVAQTSDMLQSTVYVNICWPTTADQHKD
ncbi:hypothetical protein HanIR_Chr10g0487101 [Helianthus annuus]|nr:hypothetical protein HanIR_Chr10g0487101 [Helianthus annuus]